MLTNPSEILCLHCSAANAGGARFCQNCGKALKGACPTCGTVNPPGARFCNQCGAVLTAVPDTPPADIQKEKAPAAQAQMEGERRPVAILFTDIVDSTAIAERLDPEDWREVVSGAHQLVIQAVHRNEGTVAQLLGDGVLAFFGAPLTHEDDLQRAVRAGLEIQAAMQEYQQKVKGLVPNFLMRAGVNSGLVVVGNVGTDLHMEYLAVGDAVNLAARLQSLACPGKVVISKGIFQALAHMLEFTDLGLVRVKGKTEPVHVYQVERFKSAPARRPTAEAAALPMVGREEELTRLQDLTAAVQAGIGRVAILTGEPGVGKSRLVAEWKITFSGGDPASLRWVEGHCLSYGQEIAYHLVNDLLRSLMGVTASTGQTETLAALQALLQEQLGNAWLEPYTLLGHLLALPLEEQAQAQVRGLDPVTLQGRYLAALQKVLSAMACRTPLVVLCEDLHWADPSSVEVLTRLLPLTREAPLFFCFTSRLDQNVAGWKLIVAARAALGAGLTEINLLPLSSRATDQMVANLLDSQELPEGVRQLILQKSEGNPLFIEEVVRMLVERGILLRKDGAWTAQQDLGAVEIPDSLKRLVLSRIDRLEEAPRRVLRVASVIGREFPVKVLERVYRDSGPVSPQEKVASHLSTLEYASLVKLAATRPELRYLFYHAVIQEAAYEAMLKSDRRLLHRAVAEALEGAFPDNPEDLAATLGYHFGKGEVPEKAVRYLSRAADTAQSRYANQEAIGLYYQAIEMAEQLSQTAADTAPWREQAAILQESLGDVLDLVGQHKEARTAYQQAVERYPAGDPVRLARLQRKTAGSWLPQHGWDEALQAYEAAEKALGPEQDKSALAWWREWTSIQTDRMELYYWQNRVDEINRLAARVRPVVEQYGSPAQKGTFYQNLVLASIRQERYRILSQTLADMQASIAFLQEAGKLSSLDFPYFLQGFIHLWHGDLGPAEEEMQKSLSLARQTGDITTESRCLTYLTICYRMLGQVEKARRTGQQSEEAAIRAGMTEYRGTARANLAWAAWRQGETDEARRLAQEALEQWQKIPAGHASCSFIWTANLPLLAMSVAEGQVERSIGYTQALLNPAVMRLPDPLEQALQVALAAWQQKQPEAALTQLHRSVELAKEHHYL
jgi:class 3 adenylate cyclase/tetratricopeptide (TPR) repeat protein